MQPFPSHLAHPTNPQYNPPPSSQPARQRSHTLMPAPRNIPSSNQHVPRRPPTLSGLQSTGEQELLNFPYAPPSRPPSSRPPSEYSLSRLSSSQAEHEGRESSLHRPGSSYGGSMSDHEAARYQPMSASQAMVDHYQPPRSGVNDAISRGGAQVYQTAREPKSQRAQEILANLAGLREWLEQTSRDRDENEKANREAMSDRLKALEKDNRDIKEAIHELGMGQKVLPTKTELGEELTNQISPALETFFDSLHHTLRTTIEPLSSDITKQTAEKIKLIMLELQDTAKREALQHGAIETPLTGLMNHLVQSLSPLQNISKTLESLSSLPEALHNVAVFQQTMDEMKDRFSHQTSGPSDISTTGPSSLATAIKILSSKLDEIKLQLASMPSATISSDSSQLVSAIQTLADKLGSRLVSSMTLPHATHSSAPVSSSIHCTEVSAVGQTHQERVSTSASDLILSSRHVIAATTLGLPHVNLIPPSSEPHHESPAAIAERSEAIESAKWDRTRLIVREEDRHRSPTVTAPAALRGMLIGDDEDGENESTPPASRGSLFTKNITNTAPVTSTKDSITTGITGSAYAEKRKRTPNQPVNKGTFAQAMADSSVAKNQGATSLKAMHIPQKESITGRDAESAVSNIVTTESVAPPMSQIPETEPTYISSGSNPPKRRKTSSNTRAVKQERLSGHLLGYKPTTRSEASKAKEAGIDIINLTDTQSSGSRTNSSGSRKSRTKSRRDTAAINKGSQVVKGPESNKVAEPEPVPSIQSQSQPANGKQIRQETMASQSFTQPGSSRPGSFADLDFGHGQALSVPSLPAFGSTNLTFETQEPTLGSLSANFESPTSAPKQSTSTDRVEATPSLAVFTPRNHQNSTPETSLTTPSLDTLPAPTRSAPPYRRFQAYGKAAHAKKLRSFGKSFAAMDSDED